MTAAHPPDSPKTSEWMLQELDIFQHSLRHLMSPEMREFHVHSIEIVNHIVTAYLSLTAPEKLRFYRLALACMDRARRLLLAPDRILTLSAGQRARLLTDLAKLEAALKGLTKLLLPRTG